MSDAMREQVDRHEVSIRDLQDTIAQLDARQQVLSERIDMNQQQTVQILTRIEHKQDETQKEVKETKRWINQSEGGLKLGRWIMGISLTLTGIAVAILQFFKGS